MLKIKIVNHMNSTIHTDEAYARPVIKQLFKRLIVFH